MNKKRLGLILFAGTVVITMLCVLPTFVAPDHKAKLASAKNCMRDLQVKAELYGKQHQGKYAESYREILPLFGGKKLPPNQLSLSSNYVFNLPVCATREILKGDVGVLMSFRQPAKIAYGATEDNSNFVVIGFNSAERDAKPFDDNLITVLCAKGADLKLDPAKLSSN